MAHQSHSYGHIPDAADARDHIHHIPKAAVLPPICDLRNLCPPVYDQGQLGSCTAHAISAAIEMDLRSAGRPNWMPSRLFLYYNERAREDHIKKDCGAQLRDGMKSVAKLGICPEVAWAYDPEKFAVKPPAAAYKAAHGEVMLKYRKVAQQTPQAMEQVLFSGKPIILAFHVYDSFDCPEVARTGIMPMPTRFEQPLGGHAVLCVGYDRQAQRFLIRNSWGTGWGQGGYFWMPYEFYCDPKHTFNFWVIDALS